MVRAKMTVTEITRHLGAAPNVDGRWSTGQEMHRVKLSAVTTGSPEDNTFAAATPYAALDISITNPKTVGFFELGKAYYLDFSPADAANDAGD